MGLINMKTSVGDLSLVLRALRFAAHKHRDQRRKDEGASPYINHPIAVLQTLWEIGEVHDINTLVAGILHDTIEDTNTCAEELEREFGTEVSSIVEEVSDDKSLPKKLRKRLQIEHARSISVQAREIKLADKICNVQDIMDSPPVHWSLEKQLEYVDWAEKVVNGLRGTNGNLERYFDDLCSKVRAKVNERKRSC
jgi:guanosine-3',5'-bis(diphosphate) 3'-pyrophosphohydrolase